MVFIKRNHFSMNELSGFKKIWIRIPSDDDLRGFIYDRGRFSVTLEGGKM